MDVARIRLNDTCNLACAYCTERRPVETPSFIAPAAVKQRIDAAVKAGAKELVLTGGEPTLRRDLPEIIRYCAASKARVVLETNATKIDRALAERLKPLHAARVHLPRSPWVEADQSVVDGLTALHEAGVTLEASVPLISSNREHRARLLADLKRSGLLDTIVAVVPVTSPDPTELLTLTEAGRALEELDTQCRHEGLTLRLAGGTPLPPCQLEKPSRLAYLFTLTRGGANRPDCARTEACATCVMNDLCPGLPLGVRAEARPLTDERLRRKLSTASTVEEQIDRELITRDVRRRPSGLVRENIVRVNFRCNQACTFCFVSTHLPSAKEAAIEAGILEVAREGGVVTLSGGEPTLNPRLLDYVKLARAEGAREVELQTNATRLGDRALTEALVTAGLDVAFVSLHASTAELSDRITEAPGTFVKTLAGLDELHRTKVELRINFVFCQANVSDFPAFVELVTTRWPRAAINVSFVAPSTDVVPREVKLIPRYSEVLPFLDAGVALAEQRGTRVIGLDSMCGVPFCLIPPRVVAQFTALQEAPDARGEFVKTDACARCSMQKQCFGLRSGYAALHGTGELHPLDASA